MSPDINADASNTTRVRWLVWLLFALTFVLSALGLVLLTLSWATPMPDIWGFRGGGAILALAFGSVGLLLARHRPQNPIGWLFLVAGLVGAIGEFGIEYAVYALLMQPGALPGGVLAGWTASWVWVLWITALLYIFLIFPTGRLPSARWRPVAWVVVGTYALGTFAWMVRPGPLWFAPYLDNPVANQRVANWINQVAGITALSSLLVGVSIILRLRRATGVERQQLKWFAYAAALIVVIGMIYSLGGLVGLTGNDPKFFQFFTVAVWITIAFTVGLAILRYRLLDIDIIIHRTLVYGTLSAGIVVTYILLVGLFGTLLNTNVNLAAGIVTLLLAAFLFQPVRTRLQRRVDRVIDSRQDSTNTTNADESQRFFNPTVRAFGLGDCPAGAGAGGYWLDHQPPRDRQ